MWLVVGVLLALLAGCLQQHCAVASYVPAQPAYPTPPEIVDKLSVLQHQHVWQTLDGTRKLVTDLKAIPQDRWHPGKPRVDEAAPDAETVLGSEGPPRTGRCAGTVGRWCQDWWASDAEPNTPAAGGTKDCPGDCNGVGVCNHDIGVCQCPAGWQGEDCRTPKKRPCTNRWSMDHEPVGTPYSFIDDSKQDKNLLEDGWMASRCAGVCDDVYGGCLCGYNSTHRHIPAPDSAPPGSPPIKQGRAMHDGCKPSTNAEGKKIAWGSLPWDSLYGAKGWCEAQPSDLTTHCGCPYDNLGGVTCQDPKMAYCPNQCNLRGRCILGFCKCDAGWYGTTCDRRKAGAGPPEPVSSEQLWRDTHLVWREPQQLSQDAHRQTRRRPLIFIYDLPAEYNAQFLQYRLVPGVCAWRGFNDGNDTVTHTGVYTLETYFHETLVGSPHRTLNPEEADFFFLPMYISCYMWPILGWADGPWWHAPIFLPRPMHAANMVLEAKRWVQKHYPYWDRRGGRDHIFLMTHDEGACYMPTEVYQNAIILTHWGRTDLNHTSGSAYVPDDYGMACNNYPRHQPGDWRELYKGHPCYTPGKDLVIPAQKHVELFNESPLLGHVPYVRDVLLFLRGDVGLHREWWYSRGVRQTLYRLAMEDSWREKYGVVIGVSTQYGGNYATWLARSKFCLVAPGDGWSARSEDAVLNGCIPVLINDGVDPVFSGILDWDKFSVRIPQAQIHRTPHILRAITDRQLRAMQRELATVWTRFAYVSGPYHQPQLSRSFAEHAGVRNATRLDAHHPYRPLTRYPVRNDAFHTVMQWLAARIPYTRGPEVVLPQADAPPPAAPPPMEDTGARAAVQAAVVAEQQAADHTASQAAGDTQPAPAGSEAAGSDGRTQAASEGPAQQPQADAAPPNTGREGGGEGAATPAALDSPTPPDDAAGGPAPLVVTEPGQVEGEAGSDGGNVSRPIGVRLPRLPGNSTHPVPDHVTGDGEGTTYSLDVTEPATALLHM